MINPETGSLSFQDPIVEIGPALTRSEFRSASLSEDAADWVINEPWRSWKIAGVCVAESIPFIVVLYFHGERLAMIDLCHSDPKFGTSWNDYSLEKEMSRKASHNRWLAASLGTQRTFPWGSAQSEYDQRSGGSSIIIRYESKRESNS
jgi:hypothetical protein